MANSSEIQSDVDMGRPAGDGHFQVAKKCVETWEHWYFMLRDEGASYFVIFTGNISEC